MKIIDKIETKEIMGGKLSYCDQVRVDCIGEFLRRSNENHHFFCGVIDNFVESCVHSAGCYLEPEESIKYE